MPPCCGAAGPIVIPRCASSCWPGTPSHWSACRGCGRGRSCCSAPGFDAEPPDEHGGQQDKDSLLGELPQDTPAWRAQRGPGKAKSLLGKGGEELHAHRVRRERVQADVGDERQPK